MRKETQRNTNPFPYSDTNKRYHTFDYFVRKTFGEKCAKISLDAGFTCPNIDGRTSTGGCIYCKNGSSSFHGKSLREQYLAGAEVMKAKWDCRLFIPYLQAHTNTYAPIEVLRRIYEEVSSFEGAVMLSIATRADCLEDEVVELLGEVSRKIPLTVELGLQSAKDETAALINRGHTYGQFLEGYERLRAQGGNIRIAVHLISGLPGEDLGDMVESAKKVGALRPDMIKLHLLHVLRGTPLSAMYNMGKYVPMTLEEYVLAVCDQLEVIPAETVIGRVTGDGVKEDLTAPLWSLKKTVVANEIDKELFRRDSFQGKYFNR